MGTNIHLHVELKVAGKWEHFQAPSIEQDYELFHKMAGVRWRAGYPTPIVHPRGLPEDLTLLTRLDAADWKEDMHHASWLNRKEVARLCEWWEKREEQMRAKFPSRPYLIFEREITGGYLFGNGYDGEVSFVEDVRLVFWFDC